MAHYVSKAAIFHLPAIQFDHKPLLVKLKGTLNFHPRPFRFVGMWILEQGSIDVVRRAWGIQIRGSSPFQVIGCIMNVKLAFKKWNKQIFGRVQEQIAEVSGQIEGIQSCYASPESVDKENKLQGVLDNLYRKEQLLWKEKSKETWMEEGDQNSRFFHLSTIIRRRINYMDAILDNNQEAVSDHEGIGKIFTEFYKDVFATVDPSFPTDFEGLYP